MNYHFIGIGGAGMAPIASYLHQTGHNITGSDLNNSSRTNHLKSIGIKITLGHGSLDLGAIDCICYTSAIDKKTNIEYLYAKKNKVKLLHRSQILAEIAANKKLIAISGTHGKTTTSALSAHLLVGLGVDLSVIIGAQTPSMPVGCRVGKSEYLLIEADESDGSFSRYHPFINVIHNIAEDHMDHFESYESIESAFINFANSTDKDGICLFGWDHKNIRDFSQKVRGNYLGYGLNIGTDIRCYSWDTSPRNTKYKIMINKQSVEGSINLYGKHNIQNLLAAISIASFLQLDLSKIPNIISTFTHVSRRSQIIGSNEDTVIIDDYAHNPDKISAFCTSIRAVYPNRKLVVIYQPHKVSRYNSLYNKFISSFVGCDFVGVLPIFKAGENIDPIHDRAQFSQDVQLNSATISKPFLDFQDAVSFIKSNLAQKNVIITLGAGDINTLAPLICKSLKMDLNHEKKKIQKK